MLATVDAETRDTMTEKADNIEVRLIGAVKTRPQLFDKNHKLYHNVANRAIVWESISKKMGLPVEECKAKWKSIRDKFVKLQNKTTKSGTPNPETSWELYPILSFLQDHVKHKSPSSGSNFDQNKSDQNSVSAGQDDDDMECDSLDTHLSDDDDDDDKETDPNKRKRTPKGLLRAMLRKKKRLDDVDYFCHSLAERLKRLDKEIKEKEVQ